MSNSARDVEDQPLNTFIISYNKNVETLHLSRRVQR